MSASAGCSGNQVEAADGAFGRIAHTPVRFAIGSTDDAIYREGSQVPGKRLRESLLGHKLAAEWAESETGRSVAGCKIDALHAGNGSKQRQMISCIGTQADADFMDGGVAQAWGEAQSLVQDFLNTADGGIGRIAAAGFAGGTYGDTAVGPGHLIVAAQAIHDRPGAAILAVDAQMDDLPALGGDGNLHIQLAAEGD